MEVDESRPRRLSRVQSKARTRALMLDAAAQTFARKGFAGASVDEIAESAGFSVGALYSNFSSKEELFVELLDSRGKSRLAEAVGIVSDQNTSVEASQAGLSRLLIEVADDDTDLAPLQAEFWLYAIRRPEFQEHLAVRFRSDRDALATVLAGPGQGPGAIRPRPVPGRGDHPAGPVPGARPTPQDRPGVGAR